MSPFSLGQFRIGENRSLHKRILVILLEKKKKYYKIVDLERNRLKFFCVFLPKRCLEYDM